MYTFPFVRASACAVLALASATVSAQATFEKIKQRGQINVGFRPAAPPFSMKDAAGQPTGYAVEFCKAAVERLQAATGGGKAVKYIEVQVDERFRLLREGSIDMLCDSSTDTPERRATVDFSTPIFVDAVQVMVRTKDNITSLAQLAGKQVVVINTTTAPAAIGQYATQKGMDLKIAKAVGADAAYGQLQLGWAQGYARDGVLLASQKAALPTGGDYAILPDRLSSEPIAIGFRRGDAAMRQLMDGVVTQAMQNGNLQAWYDKYFLKSVPPAKPLGIPMSDELKTLIAKAK